MALTEIGVLGMNAFSAKSGIAGLGAGRVGSLNFRRKSFLDSVLGSEFGHWHMGCSFTGRNIGAQ